MSGQLEASYVFFLTEVAVRAYCSNATRVEHVSSQNAKRPRCVQTTKFKTLRTRKARVSILGVLTCAYIRVHTYVHGFWGVRLCWGELRVHYNNNIHNLLLLCSKSSTTVHDGDVHVHRQQTDTHSLVERETDGSPFHTRGCVQAMLCYSNICESASVAVKYNKS